MKRRAKTFFLFPIVFMLFLSPYFCVVSHAETSPVATLRSRQGAVESKVDTASLWISAIEGAEFHPGTTVRTGENSRAGLLFREGVLLRLNELSLLELKNSGNKAPEQAAVSISEGDAYFFSRSEKEFPRIDTPLVSASIRGTEFTVSVRKDQVSISVLEGRVEASNSLGSVLLTNGEQAIVVRGQAPTKQVMVRPLDAVQWVIHYPVILSAREFPEFLDGASEDQKRGFKALIAGDTSTARSYLTGQSWRDTLGLAFVSYQEGNAEQAIKRVTSSTEQSASLELFKASLYLSVGQVDKANAALSASDSLIQAIQNPEAKSGTIATSEALKTIIALAKNDKQTATNASKKALAEAPESAASQLTASYVDQSRFDLSGALTHAEKAVQASPSNPALVARLAELLMSTADLKSASNLIQSSSQTAPVQDARLLAVSGFVSLSRNEVEEALAFFHQSIAKDSSAGLAYLGLGLAKIRSGLLEEGKKHIEEAVALEPTNALYRSYLGKAYFENKQNAFAEKELSLAKALDPSDPTPYLYSAYNKLSLNRPIEALEEIEDSIERNDNRAVYRSKLLLDQDLAVRGLGLSQIYSDLGFADAARDEAIKSIQRDYTNYSAHLLLSQTYLNLGRVFSNGALSELFVSSILAPRNFNFFGSSGQSQASFNEYASLFDRNRVRSNITFEHKTGAKDTMVSVSQAITREKGSYLIGYEYNHLDGFRINDQELYHTFYGRAQFEPNVDTTLSSTTFFAAGEEGDNVPSFTLDANDPDFASDFAYFFQQFGFRQQISPSLLFVSQLFGSRNDTDNSNPLTEVPFFLATENSDEEIERSLEGALFDRRDHRMIDVYRADSQLIHSAELATTIFGLGYTVSRTDAQASDTVSEEEPVFSFPALNSETAINDWQRFLRAYTYSTIHAAPWLDFNLGGSFVHLNYNDHFFPPYSSEFREITRLNIKTGATAYLTDATTLRAAYFENVGAISLNELGDIEPSLVSGFNQAVTDFPGVTSKNYGVGLTHKVAKSTYIGTQYLRRNLERKINLTIDEILVDPMAESFTRRPVSSRFDFNNSTNYLRSYLNQILSSRITLTLDHVWTDNEAVNAVLSDQVPGQAKTNRIGNRISYFFPSGIILYGEASWTKQELENYGNNLPFVSDGKEQFWLANVGARYVLPSRIGTFGISVTNLFDENIRFFDEELTQPLLPERSLNIFFSGTF